MRRLSLLLALGLGAATLAVVGSAVREPAGAQVTCFGSTPTIYAVPGVPTEGTDGPDVIWGTPGADVIRARGGDDKICARSGADRVWAGSGSDRIDLGHGNDVAIAGKGPDLVQGKRGRDILRGNGGNDTLNGGGGADQIHGGNGADVVRGRKGDDLVRGNGGNDTVEGGSGDDICFGGGGSDQTSSCSSTRYLGDRFTTRPVGASLPSGAECARRVRPAAEVRHQNRSFNTAPGRDPHDEYPRVSGYFTGTTDEIIQWVACKWGIDEDLVRAQLIGESWWDQRTQGDFTSTQSRCHPALRTGTGSCPESIGLGQVKYRFHSGAYEDANAIRSSAYNLDYTYNFWRRCYEGRMTWLNNVERGRRYAAGDALGCLGVWFSGNWYTDDAVDYIDRVLRFRDARTWETREFLNSDER